MTTYTDTEDQISFATINAAPITTKNTIAATRVESIFEKFRSIEKGKDIPRGSGLGLAIAKHIVTAHGGTIWVESKKGTGSTFYFSLPHA